MKNRPPHRLHLGCVTTTMLVAVLSILTASLALAQKHPEREAYFGEQHLHTSWSFDAFAFGDTLTGPEDFYRYALGHPTPHPGGYTVKITKPLDWAAVTEHSEYMGMIQEASDPDSVLRKSSPFLAETLRRMREESRRHSLGARVDLDLDLEVREGLDAVPLRQREPGRTAFAPCLPDQQGADMVEPLDARQVPMHARVGREPPQLRFERSGARLERADVPRARQRRRRGAIRGARLPDFRFENSWRGWLLHSVGCRRGIGSRRLSLCETGKLPALPRFINANAGRSVKSPCRHVM